MGERTGVDGPIDRASGRSGSVDRRAALRAGLAAVAAPAVVAACSTAPSSPPAAPPPTTSTPRSPGTTPGAIDLDAAPAAILPRATVPVLCWHQLREWRPDDSQYSRAAFICPPENFRRQIEAIAGAGYTTIGPDAYLAHLTTGAPLPPRPVLLSFDDSQGSQMTVGLPELARHRMTATFFVMTVPLDKPNWMSTDDVRRLAGEGMTVAAHTYDHHRADRYTGDDWTTQLDEPRAQLEAIVRAPVRHFAYPFGAWSREDFAHLRTAGYVTGFQLREDAIDPTDPLLTLRRTLVTSTWTGPQILAALAKPV